MKKEEKELKDKTMSLIDEWLALYSTSRSLYFASLSTNTIVKKFSTSKTHDTDVADVINKTELRSNKSAHAATIALLTALHEIELLLTDIFITLCDTKDSDILGFVIPKAFNEDKKLYSKFFIHMSTHFDLVDLTSFTEITDPSCVAQYEKMFLVRAEMVMKEKEILYE